MTSSIFDFIILTIGRVVIMITQIVSMKIYTSLLNPFQIGRLSIILSIMGLFGLILISPVGTYFSRRVLEWNAEGVIKKYLYRYLLYLCAVTLFAILVILLIKKYVLKDSMSVSNYWIILIIIGNLLFMTVNTSYLSWVNIFGKRLFFVITSILVLWAGLLFAYIFVSSWGYIAENWFAGQIFANTICAVLVFIVFNKIVNNKAIQPSTNIKLKEVINFSYPLMISAALYWCHMQGYRFVFSAISSIEVLGYFTVGYTIGASILFSFETVFHQYYMPIYYSEISHAIKETRSSAWNKYATLFYPVLFAFICYIALSGKYLSVILTGNKFHGVGTIVIWGALSEGGRIMNSSISLVGQSEIQMKPLIVPGILGVSIVYALLFLLMPINAIVGCGIALIIGSIVSYVYSYINMNRLLSIKIPIKRIIYSVLLMSPIYIYYLLIDKFITTRNGMSNSIIILLGSGIYFVAVVYMLTRKYIQRLPQNKILDTFETKFKESIKSVLNIWS